MEAGRTQCCLVHRARVVTDSGNLLPLKAGNATGQLRGRAQDEVTNVAAPGSMSFPQRKLWSLEDSGSSHHLTSNSGGQSPRSPALGRGPKGIGESVHDWKCGWEPWPTKWII